MLRARDTFLLFLTVWLITGLTGCFDSEATARKIFNEALTFQQQGRVDKTVAAYRELVNKYPETQTAVEANKLLGKLLGCIQTIMVFTQGDPGTKYSGHINIVSRYGDAREQVIEGAVPKVYDFRGSMVIASFRKTEDTENKLTILISDEKRVHAPVRVATTEVPYGDVTVSMACE